jgi:hypothetical protein
MAGQTTRPKLGQLSEEGPKKIRFSGSAELCGLIERDRRNL